MHAYTWRKNGIGKEAIVLQWAIRIASWDFKQEEEEEEEEEEEGGGEEEETNILAVCRLSGSVLLRCFLASLGVLSIMKTLEDEW